MHTTSISLDDAKQYRQFQEEKWASFKIFLKRRSLLYGSEGAAIRHLIKEYNAIDSYSGEFDYVMFCFLCGLDCSYTKEIEKIAIKT